MIIEGAIFDMDGLMMDTERLVFENWQEIMTKKGYSYTADDFRKTIGKRRIETEQIMKAQYGEDFPYLECADECHVLFIEKTERDGIPVKKGLFELLQVLKERGVKTAVATSTRRPSAERALSMTGAMPYFDAVVCGEDVTEGKPDPEVFLKAAERIDVEPDKCAALEDSPSGITAAYRAGMKTIMVPDFIEPDDEIRDMLDLLCADLEEAISFFE